LAAGPDADDQALQAYAERLWQWQQKALREAKLQSSWSAPNEAYESG
jgi:(1->4)-alpha-D-glucan 1-alpha-D-glucosylmutase